MAKPSRPTNPFLDLDLKSEELLHHTYYVSNKICQICLKGIDALDEQGVDTGSGRKLIEDYYQRHFAIMKGVIDLLGYEPDGVVCETLFGDQ